MARNETDLVMICQCDVAGQMRGKAVPRRELEARREIGVGWTPTNVLITSFGPIAPSPWGALGDLYLRPDMTTHVDVELPELGVDENFVIGDIRTLEGKSWECCLRGQLAAAIDRLEQGFGLRMVASFEHEFHYSGSQAQPGLGYALRAMRRLGAFPNRLMTVLDAAGIDLDTFMPEYGPGQCEVTVKPQPALHAADEAAIVRELTRATARGLGARASFAPILEPSAVGNGVHVHFSLSDLEGNPICYDRDSDDGVSARAGAFVAGILRHLPDFIALTAPAVSSYYRLAPNRWSAVYNNFGRQDREASVRICPVFGAKSEDDMARKFHFEFRAADGAANPYLVLAALLHAGMDGMFENLPTPAVTTRNLTSLDTQDLGELGLSRLPQTLEEALSRLVASRWATASFGETLVDVVNRHKRAEIDFMATATDEEICARYTAAY